MADRGYIQLYGYRSKSVAVGLGCGLDCTSAQSVMIAPLRQHRRQLWYCTSEACHYLYSCLWALRYVITQKIHLEPQCS